MNVNGVDLAIVLTVVIGVWVGFRRGFGKAVFDFAALIIALRVSSRHYLTLAGKISLNSEAQANQALIFALSFVVIGGVLWLIGKLIYDATLISLDTFDPPLGGALGLGIALVIGHAIVKSLFICASMDGSIPETIAQSTLGFEFLRFPAYHSVVDVMFRLGQ